MKSSSLAYNLYIALVHYPVIGKNGEIIASAITNLDLHDISRLAKTYGVKKFYVVTPLEDQKKLVNEIVTHWTKGFGAEYNPARRQALELICVKDSLQKVKDQIYLLENCMPKIVVTSAKSYEDSVSFKKFGEKLGEKLIDDQVYLLTFGTSWGLAEKLILSADYILEPIKANNNYNHLSVRSAASIILDRLCSD